MPHRRNLSHTRIVLGGLALALVALAHTACAGSVSEYEMESIRVHAANEFDCHVDFVEVFEMEDEPVTVRAVGCGSERFWVCEEDDQGEHTLCDRVPFPAASRYIRY